MTLTETRVTACHAILLVALTIGCTATTPPPAVAPSSPELGIFYRLPKTVVEIDAKRSKIVQNVLDKDKIKRSESVEVQAEVTARTVADVRRTLDLKAGALADGSLTVTVSPEGYLQGVNSSIEGKTGTVLSNLFQIAGRILGALTLFGASTGQESPPPIPQPPAFACTPVGVPCAIRRDAFRRDAFPNEKIDCRTPVDEQRERPDPTFFGADTFGFFVVTHSGPACAAWKEHLVATANVREQARVVQREEAALKGTATSAQAQVIEERIHHATTVLRRFQATEADRSATYDAALAKFKKDNEMTPDKTTVAMRESFGIEEIPPIGPVQALKSLDIGSIEGALKGYARMFAMAEAGVFLTVIDSEAPPPASPPNPPPPMTSASSGTNDDCKNDNIAYREPVVIRIAVFKEENAEKRIFKKTDEKVITAFLPAVGCINIERSKVANRALVMEFGEFGVPKKLTRTNTSTAAAATAAVSTALTALQDTYAGTLEKVITIQASRRTIAQSDITDQIERLTKEKALLDAQIALEGSAASKDLLLQQKVAEQRLTLLQKQLELSKTEQGAATQLEIAGLKDRIALLEQQLNLLVAQRKLDEANAQP